MTRTLLFSLFLLTGMVGQAQRQKWYLDQDYGIKPQVDKARTLSEAGMTLDQAKAKYPRWYARWIAKGGTDATFMNNGTFTAAYQDAYFTGQAHNLAIMTSASGWIVIPWGEFWVTCQTYAPIGTVEGNGTFAGGWAMGSTVLSPWHERWNPEPGTPANKRNVMVSGNYGVEGYNGYHESGRVHNIRFEGRKTSPYYDPSYESSGLVVWDAGETFTVGIVRADNFNDYGVRGERGTPFKIEYLTAFWNGLGGLNVNGAALNAWEVGMLSCDDNPWMIRMIPGNGREGGGQARFGALKDETGTTPENVSGKKHNAQGIAELRGQFGVDIGVILLGASGGIRAPVAFLVDPRITNGSPQSSHLKVGSMKAHGYDWLIIEPSKKRGVRMPCEYCAFSMEYTSIDGVVKINGKELPWVAYNCPDRLGVASTYDYTNCLPTFSYTGSGGTTPVPPNPVPCTWTKSGTGACIDGRSLDTYTSSPSNCTGTAPLTYTTCTVTPPPVLTTKGLYTFSTGTVNAITSTGTTSTMTRTHGAPQMLSGKLTPTASTSYRVDWKGSTTYRFTDLNWSTAANAMSYKMLAGVIDTDGQGRGIMVLPTGAVIDNRVASGDRVLLPAGTVKPGTAVTFTVTLPTPMDATFFGAWPGQGNCWLGTLGELKVQ